jgi:hypothetical protein
MQNVQAATTLSPITRSFRHLIPGPRAPAWRSRLMRKEPTPVPAKDRIRQWNIVPGDKVRVISGPENMTLMHHKLPNTSSYPSLAQIGL